MKNRKISFSFALLVSIFFCCLYMKSKKSKFNKLWNIKLLKALRLYAAGNKEKKNKNATFLHIIHPNQQKLSSSWELFSVVFSLHRDVNVEGRIVELYIKKTLCGCIKTEFLLVFFILFFRRVDYKVAKRRDLLRWDIFILISFSLK